MRTDGAAAPASEAPRGAAPELRWQLVEQPAPEPVVQLAEALGLPPELAALLVQRGFNTPDLARRFLRPSLDELSDPLSLAGMAQAVETIVAAIRDGKGILVHGDYDVDGQCAAALLTRVLRMAGARVTPFIPHRLRDGYDFGPAGLAAARAEGAGLIVTCDCGITAVDTVRAAEAEGIAVVVTDHHLPGAVLPPAHAVVDPQRADDTSGTGALCGTGIAFKLVQALVPVLGLPAALPFHFLDYVALATVADVVPLVGENRIFVRHGLKLLSQPRWPGLKALLATAGLEGKEVRAGHLGFVVGPRLNAAGRIGDPMDGLRLLLTDDAVEAKALAQRLDTLNTERQRLDQRTLEEVLARVSEMASDGMAPGLVLSGDDWHPGVVGIVASRVVERYGRPTFLIAFDGPIGKGSGRSISAVNLHHALADCADLLERYGGHHMAAGLTIRRENLDAFRSRFATAVSRAVPDEALGPEQRVDLEVDLSHMTHQLVELCRHLEPCGMGNPLPVFGVRRVRLANRSRVGSGHLKGVLEQDESRLSAIGFQWADRVPWIGDGPIDAAFRLELNEWQGSTSLQARLVAVSPHRPPGSTVPLR